MEGIIIEGDDGNTFSLGQNYLSGLKNMQAEVAGKQVDTSNLKERGGLCLELQLKLEGSKEQVSPGG